MTAQSDREKTNGVGTPGLLFALALAIVAPATAWAIHAWLGLYLAPGRWTGWGATLGVFGPWVWVLVAAPVLEELAMRPLLQNGLRHQLDRILRDGSVSCLTKWSGSGADWRGHLANVGAALVFAMLHLPANGLSALWWLVPAAAIGEVWRRSANWWLCAVLHAWFNACLAGVTICGGVGCS